MYKKVLVKEQIEDGKRLLDELARHRFRWAAAFWYELPEVDNWRLVIATPLVDSIGSSAAYTKLHVILRELNPPTGLSVSNVSLLSPSSPRFHNFRSTLRGRYSPPQPYLYGGAEDAYIYKI